MSIKYMTRIFDLPVPPVQKIVLLVLADAANEQGVSWVGMQHVSEKSSVSVRTVLRALSQSEDEGLVVRRPRYRKDRSRTSNEYWLFPRDHGGDNLSQGGVGAEQGGVPPVSVPPDTVVAVTTTESPVNHLNHHHSAGLVFPSAFSSATKGAARQLLIGLSEEVAQQLLDEVAGRQAGGGIRSSPISYLRSLVVRQAEGSFVPELAWQVAERRQVGVLKQQVQVPPPKPAAPEIAANHLAELKKKLGNRC